MLPRVCGNPFSSMKQSFGRGETSSMFGTLGKLKSARTFCARSVRMDNCSKSSMARRFWSARWNDFKRSLFVGVSWIFWSSDNALFRRNTLARWLSTAATLIGIIIKKTMNDTPRISNSCLASSESSPELARAWFAGALDFSNKLE